jgi:hypothetical protein
MFVSAKYSDGLYKTQSYAIKNGSLVKNITFTEPFRQKITPKQIMLHSSGKILIIEQKEEEFGVFESNGRFIQLT